MEQEKNYEVGDIIKMRKPHPCGCDTFLILRVGMDFRLKCTGCGHQMMMPRKTVVKSTKRLEKKES